MLADRCNKFQFGPRGGWWQPLIVSAKRERGTRIDADVLLNVVPRSRFALTISVVGPVPTGQSNKKGRWEPALLLRFFETIDQLFFATC